MAKKVKRTRLPEDWKPSADDYRPLLSYYDRRVREFGRRAA